MKKLDVVGQSIPRVDAYEKVTGKATYVGDMSLPGMLYGKVYHSPVAHAMITKIHTEKARALPGVEAVITYEDVPNIPFTTCGHPLPFDTPLDSLILSKHVRYVGDPVAAVAATTPEIAAKAVSLIEIEYDELPAYFTSEDAMAPGAVEIHEGSKNLAGENAYEIGDVDDAFKNAAYVFEDVFETPIITHSPIEPHVSLVDIDHKGRLTLYVSNQVPHILRERIAYALGLKIKDLRVIKGHVGGGFGGKQEPVYEPVNCVLTQVTKRPVMLELTREECLATTRTRHSSKLKLRSALDSNFNFIAREAEVVNNTGAYSSHGHNVMFNIATQFALLYPTPNIRFSGKSVYTNILIGAAMRAYGIPQWTFAMESHIDNIAHNIGMNPLEFRKQVVYKVGDPIIVDHMSVDTCGLPEILEKGTELIGWNNFEHTVSDDGKIKRGIGMACCSYGQSCYPHSVETSSARVSMNEDGSATLFIGCTEIGQGCDTVMGQICAEAIGIPFDWVKVIGVDTDICPMDPGAFASRQTYVSGMAVKKAGEACKADILGHAHRQLTIAKERLDIKEGYIIDTFDDNRKVCPLEDVMMKIYYSVPHAGSICHQAYHSPTNNFLTFGAAFAIVKVDTGTGQVDVEKLITMMDSGRLINPQTAMGQLTGGGMMSYGFGLTEQILVNPKTGKVYNDNLLDYKVPTMADVPDMTGIFVETDEASSAYGNKSLGEPPNLAPAVAIRNAVYDATGVAMNKIPLTPERVLMNLKAAEKERSGK